MPLLIFPRLLIPVDACSAAISATKKRKVKRQNCIVYTVRDFLILRHFFEFPFDSFPADTN